MNCLKNFIGMRQACAGGHAPAPRSGMYIEDYPGITRTALQAIEPGVWLNAQAFLDAMVASAWTNVVEVDARAAIEDYIVPAEALEVGRVGVFSESTLPPVGTRRGLRIRKNAGSLSKLLISSVTVRADLAGTFALTITDGTTPATFDVVISADRVGHDVTEWVHYETAAASVDITITDAGFVPYTGSTQQTRHFSSCRGCDNGVSTYAAISGRGLTAAGETDAVQGISANVALTCDIAPAVCLLATRLKVPIFYATVMQILRNWEATPRMNFYAQHKAEWLEREWHRLSEERYPQAWDLHAKGLARFASQLDPLCVDCGTGTRLVYGNR